MRMEIGRPWLIAHHGGDEGRRDHAMAENGDILPRMRVSNLGERSHHPVVESLSTLWLVEVFRVGADLVALAQVANHVGVAPRLLGAEEAALEKLEDTAQVL